MSEAEIRAREFERKVKKAGKAGKVGIPPPAKPKNRSPFADYLIPRVATRLNIPTHDLRRAVQRGEVEVFMWGGRPRITPKEEARIAGLMKPSV